MRRAQFFNIFVAAGALAAPLGARAAPFECLIQPNQIVEIRSPVEGLISKVHVQRGDSAKAGQVLVELESSAERSRPSACRSAVGRWSASPSSRQRVGASSP